MHSDGFNVGLPFKRQRWFNIGDGGNQFINDVISLWSIGQFIVKCKFYACALADNVIFCINICGITPNCRLFIKEVDHQIQRYRVVQ